MFAGVCLFGNLPPTFRRLHALAVVRARPGEGSGVLHLDLPELAHRCFGSSGINGGPHFQFSEVLFFTINCRDQDDVDYYCRDRLTSAGGHDTFGLSWQVVWRRPHELVSHPDPAVATAVAQAM